MTAGDQDASAARGERRRSSRVKAHVTIELHREGDSVPIRGETADISLNGCYIETMFPFPIGTKLEMRLQVDGTLIVDARVITCDPQFGNGIEFVKLLPEDQAELKAFVEAALKNQQP